MLVHTFLRHYSEYFYVQIQKQTPNIRSPKACHRASDLACFHLHGGRGLANRVSANSSLLTADPLAADGV